MSRRAWWAAVLVTSSLLAGMARAQNKVIDSRTVVPAPGAPWVQSFAPRGAECSDPPSQYGLTTAVTSSDPAPGGVGTMNPRADSTPAGINSFGQLAFEGRVDGNPNNQGLFMWDPMTGLHWLVNGCGGIG